MLKARMKISVVRHEAFLKVGRTVSVLRNMNTEDLANVRQVDKIGFICVGSPLAATA